MFGTPGGATPPGVPEGTSPIRCVMAPEPWLPDLLGTMSLHNEVCMEGGDSNGTPKVGDPRVRGDRDQR